MMFLYIWLFYNNVYSEVSTPIHSSTSDIIIKTEIPKGYYLFLLRILFAFIIVIYLLITKEFDFSYLITCILIITFLVIQFYSYSFIKKNNPFYCSIGKDSVESHIDYTNRIYYTDIKQIKVNSEYDKYQIISNNGNLIKINLKHYPKEFRTEVFSKFEELSKHHNVELFLPVG
ncbi:MAG TPA: hypothetical protein VLH59_07765 [Ignavibacteriaceae bacterium]|nr:hypothetical protein [Ignavibacteriaceae bacterium]